MQKIVTEVALASADAGSGLAENTDASTISAGFGVFWEYRGGRWVHGKIESRLRDKPHVGKLFTVSKIEFGTLQHCNLIKQHMLKRMAKCHLTFSENAVPKLNFLGVEKRA
ncbi:MAG: hypothetical protein LBB38_02920 [Puniceicoccales bacterium]|nr:hypothetical protein [Puniceicoccales bacterium]